MITSVNKVVLVEDNDLNCKLFKDLLELKKCDVIVSKDGIGIINLVQKEQPNLILMDIQLNGISGLDIVRELKLNKNTANIPIIVITAFAMKKDESLILSSGCEMYMSKPISIDNFFKSIQQFLDIII